MTIQREIRSGRDINGTPYTITTFPDAIDYLKEKLSELGHLTFHQNSTFNYSIDVQIEFHKQPVVQDWRQKRLDGGLCINSAAGGCFMYPSIVWCRVMPQPNSKIAQFHFDLEIDTRDGYPVEKHDIQIVKDAIDEFVKRCKVGFCYHFN